MRPSRQVTRRDVATWAGSSSEGRPLCMSQPLRRLAAVLVWLVLFCTFHSICSSSCAGCQAGTGEGDCRAKGKADKGPTPPPQADVLFVPCGPMLGRPPSSLSQAPFPTSSSCASEWLDVLLLCALFLAAVVTPDASASGGEPPCSFLALWLDALPRHPRSHAHARQGNGATAKPANHVA